jgi:adenylate kinase family enzyme
VTHHGLKGRRIAVIGAAGAGKSTLARSLSLRLGVRHVELDALNWGPGWRGLSAEDPARFAEVVAAAVAGEAWVTDGNYARGALPQILPRASDLIWLDYGRWTVMGRVFRRSVRRALSGAELWPGTGNREDLGRWLRKDHPLRWTWDTYLEANQRREALFADPALAHVRKHRFRTPKEASLWRP